MLYLQGRPSLGDHPKTQNLVDTGIFITGFSGNVFAIDFSWKIGPASPQLQGHQDTLLIWYLSIKSSKSSKSWRPLFTRPVVSNVSLPRLMAKCQTHLHNIIGTPVFQNQRQFLKLIIKKGLKRKKIELFIAWISFLPPRLLSSLVYKSTKFPHKIDTARPSLWTPWHKHMRGCGHWGAPRTSTGRFGVPPGWINSINAQWQSRRNHKLGDFPISFWHFCHCVLWQSPFWGCKMMQVVWTDFLTLQVVARVSEW